MRTSPVLLIGFLCLSLISCPAGSPGSCATDFPSNSTCFTPTDPTEEGLPRPDYTDVLLIENQNSPISRQIASYFTAQRTIPSKNICSVSVTTNEIAAQADYDSLVSQVQTCLTNTPNNINYLLNTKGIPLAYLNTNISPSNTYSVDNALALINASKSLQASSNNYFNPYYGRKTPFNRSNPDFQGIYLVTRLDGYDFPDIQSLIDRSRMSFKTVASSWPADEALLNYNQLTIDDSFVTPALNLIQGWGYPVALGSHTEFLMDQTNIMLAFNWGSDDGYAPIMSNTWNLGFSPGAIMDTGVSYGARTLSVEQSGGLVQVLSATSSNQYAPHVKADIPKTDLLSLAEAGTLIFAGTGDNRFYGGPASSVRGSGIFVFDTVAGRWTNTNYTKVNTGGALVGNYIYNLSYDSAHHLVWASTENGVSSFDLVAQAWTALDTGFGAHGVLINGNQLWVTTDTAGIRIYDIPSRQYLQSYTHESSNLSTDCNYAITQNPANSNIIVGTYGSGLSFFNGTNWTNLSTGNTNGDYVISLLVDGNTLWVGALTGVWQVDLTALTATEIAGTSSFEVETLAIQGDSLMIGTAWNWIQQLSRSTGTLTQMNTSLFSSELIHKIIVDSTGLWAGLGRAGQSLIADLITMGVTGVQGDVNEPGIGAISNTQVRYEAYMSGRNLAESFYAADEFIGWMSVIVGDPKAQPFQGFGLPNINYAHLDDLFYKHSTNSLNAFPLEFRGRANTSSGAGSGSWSLNATDGTVNFNLATGGINADATVDTVISDSSFLGALCNTSQLTFTLQSLDPTGLVVASDSYSGLNAVSGFQIASPANFSTASRALIVTLSGLANGPYTISYLGLSSKSSFQVSGTAGVSLVNGGSLPVSSGGTLGTIDLTQALASDTNDAINYFVIYLSSASPTCSKEPASEVLVELTP